MTPLTRSWSQSKAKAQWHRPTCNLLLQGGASQLSVKVSNAATHWTLSEKRLSKHSSFTGQLSFGVQSTNIWARLGFGGHSQHKNGARRSRKGCEGKKTWLTFSQFENFCWFLKSIGLSIHGCFIKATPAPHFQSCFEIFCNMSPDSSNVKFYIEMLNADNS